MLYAPKLSTRFEAQEIKETGLLIPSGYDSYESDPASDAFLSALFPNLTRKRNSTSAPQAARPGKHCIVLRYAY